MGSGRTDDGAARVLHSVFSAVDVELRILRSDLSGPDRDEISMGVRMKEERKKLLDSVSDDSFTITIDLKKSQCQRCRNYINRPVFKGTMLTADREIGCERQHFPILVKGFSFKIYQAGEKECPYFDSWAEHVLRREKLGG